jgi:hypothetical protein
VTKPGKSRIGTNTHAATVLVKVIAVSRDSEDDQRRYSHLVSEIVSATNRQNAIGQVHLKSNDIEQIRLERDLKKLEGTMSIYGLNFERHRPETVELPGRLRMYRCQRIVIRPAGLRLSKPLVVGETCLVTSAVKSHAVMGPTIRGMPPERGASSS